MRCSYRYLQLFLIDNTYIPNPFMKRYRKIFRLPNIFVKNSTHSFSKHIPMIIKFDCTFNHSISQVSQEYYRFYVDRLLLAWGPTLADSVRLILKNTFNLSAIRCDAVISKDLFCARNQRTRVSFQNCISLLGVRGGYATHNAFAFNFCRIARNKTIIRCSEPWDDYDADAF